MFVYAVVCCFSLSCRIASCCLLFYLILCYFDCAYCLVVVLCGYCCLLCCLWLRLLGGVGLRFVVNNCDSGLVYS